MMPLGAKYYDNSVASQKNQDDLHMSYESKIHTWYEKEAKNITFCLKLDIRWKMFPNNGRQNVVELKLIISSKAH